MCVGWGEEREDWNETIGGGGTPTTLTEWGPPTLDTRQPRDAVRRYQAPDDVRVERSIDGDGCQEGDTFVVSAEALRQAQVKHANAALGGRP